MTTHQDYFQSVIVLVNDSLVQTAMYFPKGGPASASLSPYFTGLVGLFAVLIAVVGWFIVQKLTRDNLKKGFEETVLDKIRMELIPLFLEHRKWIVGMKKVIDDLSNSNSFFKTVSAIGRPPGLDLSELKNLIKIGDKDEWLIRLNDYIDLFPLAAGVIKEITDYHRQVYAMIKDFSSNYDPQFPIYNLQADSLQEINSELSKLDYLRDNFMAFFQWECLKTMDRILKPNHSNEFYRYIRTTDYNGQWEIVEPLKRIHTF